jgi:prevent-host-death family protein
MTHWQVQDAKAHLSEVIERAQGEGPQIITRHGAERAVVLSMDDYRRLAAGSGGFKAHLLGGPKVGEFDTPRSRDTGRDFEF